jgi:hypothetical protein
MPGYRVYYRKDPTFRVDKDLTKDGVLRSGKLVYIATVNFQPIERYGPLDTVYSNMQGENMNWQNKLATRKAGVHTSMSIGDVLEEVDTGKMFQCGDPGGWDPVPARRK